MALGKIYFLIFTALVAVNIIFADDDVTTTEVAPSAGDQPSSGSSNASSNAPSNAPSNGPSNRPPNRPSYRPLASLFPIRTSCNYTVNPGSSCASCTQAIRCEPSNTGVLRTCRGLLPYCYYGRCSFLADPIACAG